jgi:hypothetical protein
MMEDARKLTGKHEINLPPSKAVEDAQQHAPGLGV